MSDEYIYPGKICSILGWGLQKHNEPKYKSSSNPLLGMSIEIDTDEFCEGYYFENMYIVNYTMCGRGREKDGRTMTVINFFNLLHFKY